MKKLLSLPPNLVECFYEVTKLPREEWFCTHDPVDRKLGSGGGSIWLLKQCYEQSDSELTFQQWLSHERRILIHAGGQSRRLPAYAPSGKLLTPIPVFRWERGQRLSQNLLSLQVPLFERMMDVASESLRTMIVSGDVLIRATKPLAPLPEADVVCYGLWLSDEVASSHGVFVAERNNPSKLKCMLQKPDADTLAKLRQDHVYLVDIGVWLLSDRAVEVLTKKSTEEGVVAQYDMYGTFGCALGSQPGIVDKDVNELTVAVVPLDGGEFYHFGTSHEIISSMVDIQNLVNDQREIMHKSAKPHPSVFIQNSTTWIPMRQENRNLWIENSCVSEKWTVSHENIITGVPENMWELQIAPGQCVDIIPFGESQWVVRPYGFFDAFRGDVADADTLYQGIPFRQWAAQRNIQLNEIVGGGDLQSARLFPVVDNVHDMGLVLRWMLNQPMLDGGKMVWQASRKLSADEISANANLQRLEEQRTDFRRMNWPFLANNYKKSIFYQIDLDNAADEFARFHIAEPHPIAEDTSLLVKVRDAMFRSRLRSLKGEDGKSEEERAFAMLRDGITQKAFSEKQAPLMSVCDDQIVWGRSPVRIDIAGGWTDTPPFCLMEGGAVVNIAIELNGQPPIQTYVRPCAKPVIILRSIDLGAAEVVETYEQLADFHHVGSPFSIPKAALSLAGFLPAFAKYSFPTLKQQLEDLGCGIEITLLSAIPAGSGLGTSSILSATVLGALNDFCGLSWDKNEIGQRTLILEQLLTSGGGWQDQFGGLLHGAKLLQTERGLSQAPVVRWLPGELFRLPEYQSCHLLYYTGITRTAKNILSEIVRRMFLNQHEQLQLLRAMKDHALDMHEAIMRNDFCKLGLLVGKTWVQNQKIDAGTNPPEIKKLTDRVDDLCLGYKLPGAGGGGYLYMVAKDPEAAARIRKLLMENRLNRNARFVEMSLSSTGLQVSRS